MSTKSVSRYCVMNYIKMLCVAGSIFFFVACDPLEPATESLYTVHFDLNGVAGATPDTQIIHEGEFAEHPYVEVDDRGSHGKFAAIEWYQNKDGSGPAFQFASTPIASSYWLYAKWTNDFRTVTFEPDYTGAKPFFRHVGTGKTVEKPFDARRTNYMFDGWHKADTSRFDFTKAIDDDIVLYAHWIRAAYTVRFDLNGAEGTVPPDQIIVIDRQNQSLALEPTEIPTRERSTFVGWLSDKADPLAFDFASTPINADITLYAGWQSEYVFAFKGREYPATLDGNTFLLNVGNTYTLINDQQVTLVRVPVGVTTKPVEGSELQLSKAWGDFKANENGQKIDYKVKVFVEPNTNAGLKAIVNDAITTEGNTVDLNFVETRQIADMSYVFSYERLHKDYIQWSIPGHGAFNGNISEWNTSKVTNMSHMFYNAGAFNGDISKWDTSNVMDMNWMFAKAGAFNGDISKWDTSDVTNMEYLFSGALVFNGDIAKWDTSSVTNMSWMFSYAKIFDGDISKWNTSKVTDMSSMFHATEDFDQDISKWNISNVTNTNRMFANTVKFNQDLSKWNTSKVTNIIFMFSNTKAFNGDISEWDISSVTNMEFLFYKALAFNQDISKWDTSNVTNMTRVFTGTKAFNGDISKWNTSKVTNMTYMFADTEAFNRDISKWNTSKVTNMTHMFYNAGAFNRDISKWDTSNVENMNTMFGGTGAFDWDISGWNVANVYGWANFIKGATKLAFDNGKLSFDKIPPKFRTGWHVIEDQTARIWL